ncbi:hypothetical protein VTO42DRAFT_3925 [Malbranchea cinnamomea]
MHDPAESSQQEAGPSIDRFGNTKGCMAEERLRNLSFKDRPHDSQYGQLTGQIRLELSSCRGEIDQSMERTATKDLLAAMTYHAKAFPH